MLSLQNPQTTNKSKLAQANRILLIEDEDLIRDMVTVALEEEGYEVHTVSNGRAALNILQSPDFSRDKLTPDLIILDMMLPEVNGQDI